MKVLPPPPSYEDLQEQNQKLSNEVERLKEELAQLKRLIFGAKSERFIPQSPPEQLSLAFDGKEEAAVPTVKETITYTRNKPSKKQPKRQPLPPNLPRIDVIIEPEEDVTGWKKIGEEITEELDYVPGRFQVIRYIRPKYVSPAVVESSDSETAIEIASEKAVVIASLPTRPIEKGIPSAGLLAHILMSKFVDHLPYYRQIQQFKRIGMTIKAATVNGWVAKSCALLEVLYNKMCELHFMQHYLQADSLPRTLSGKRPSRSSPPKNSLAEITAKAKPIAATFGSITTRWGRMSCSDMIRDEGANIPPIISKTSPDIYKPTGCRSMMPLIYSRMSSWWAAWHTCAESLMKQKAMMPPGQSMY